MIRAELLLPTLQFLDQIGSKTERYLIDVGLPVDLRCSPNAVMPLHSVFHFLSLVAQDEGIPDLGAQIGSRVDLKSLGSLGHSLQHSPTVADHLYNAILTVQKFSSGDRYWVVTHGSLVSVHHEYPWSKVPGFGHAEAYSIAVTLKLLRDALGRDWSPDRIRLAAATPATSAFIEREFGAPVIRTDFRSSITFSASDLKRPFCGETGSPDAPHEAESFDRELPIELIGGLRMLIVSELSNHSIDIHKAAEAANTNVRSLQRQLEHHGVTWRELVGRVRYEEACRLIARTDHSITDIAADLGYEHPGNFTRAFLKMAGCSPQEFRTAARNAASYFVSDDLNAIPRSKTASGTF